jgi:hypothetical protein
MYTFYVFETLFLKKITPLSGVWQTNRQKRAYKNVFLYICNAMNKIEQDKQTIRLMVGLYCRHRLRVCKIPDEYGQLIDYAEERLTHCRYGEIKPACKDCATHCYKPDMREKVREVMRWTGPRMIVYSPKAAFRHIWQRIKNK